MEKFLQRVSIAFCVVVLSVSNAFAACQPGGCGGLKITKIVFSNPNTYIELEGGATVMGAANCTLFGNKYFVLENNYNNSGHPNYDGILASLLTVFESKRPLSWISVEQNSSNCKVVYIQSTNP